MYEGFTAGPPIQIFKEKSITPYENSLHKTGMSLPCTVQTISF